MPLPLPPGRGAGAPDAGAGAAPETGAGVAPEGVGQGNPDAVRGGMPTGGSVSELSGTERWGDMVEAEAAVSAASTALDAERGKVAALEAEISQLREAARAGQGVTDDISGGLAMLRAQFDDLQTSLSARAEAVAAEALAQREQLDLMRRESRLTEASLREELRRAVEASSVLSEETIAPFWDSEGESFEGTAINPDSQGLTQEQKQRLVVSGVAKVELQPSGAVDAKALAALLIAVRDSAAQRKREGLAGHFPAALMGSQYFATPAEQYLRTASRVSARMAGAEAPATSHQWYAWLETYLSVHGPDVEAVVEGVAPFHVPAPATRLHASDVTLAVALYLEGYEVALHAANSESLGKPTTRGIVVRSVLRGLPLMLSTRVLVKYRMGADASSVPGYLTWARFREDVLEVLGALLKETETGSLGESSKVLQQFAVPKDKSGKEKDKAMRSSWVDKAQSSGRAKDPGPGAMGAVRCYNCQEEGHRSPDCPKPRKARDKGKAAKGEESTKKSGESAAKQEAGKSACFNCHKEGHRVAECPEPRRCRRCAKTGHDAASCPVRT